MSKQFYDGTKLLSLKDISGGVPELYICTTNRTGGKTTYFGRLCVNKFKKDGSKFCILYRFDYEMKDVAEKFFKDLKELFFPNDEMTEARKANGKYYELFLNEESCGYAIAINGADQIKRMSHLFNDVDRMIFDEFQSETNHYCPDEMTKFISIHTSIARGKGKQVRYVPVYLLGNQVTIINPYFVQLGISDRLREDTKFLRGDGFVMEQGYVKSASDAQSQSAFNRAFKSHVYTAYSAQGVYLNDNKAFIEKPEGKNNYIATLKYKGEYYGIREYPDLGIVYCDKKADITFRTKITVTTDDHQINFVMLKRNDFFIQTLRYYFDRGCFRFKDVQCKEVILQTLSY